jgi:hypothetical protein
MDTEAPVLEMPRFGAGVMRLVNTALLVVVAMTWSDVVAFATGTRHLNARGVRPWPTL